MQRLLGGCVIGLASLAFAGVVQAADISGSLTLASDYRSRGIELSDDEPALQAGAELAAGGFFVGAWTSNIEDFAGANAELDLTAGYRLESDSWTLSAWVLDYVYPRGGRLNYVELNTAFERKLGASTLSGLLAWTPEQDNAATTNTYVSLALETPLPRTPLSLTLQAGYEDGFFDSKKDWSVALGASAAGLDWSLGYSDSSARDYYGAKPARGVYGSVTKSF